MPNRRRPRDAPHALSTAALSPPRRTLTDAPHALSTAALSPPAPLNPAHTPSAADTSSTAARTALFPLDSGSSSRSTRSARSRVVIDSSSRP
jgi:hypothetical protein